MTTIATYDFNTMQLRVANARAAFADPSKLEGAFIWAKTPQGEEYWREQSKGLTEEGWATLAYMIAQSVELSVFGARAAA